MCAQNVNSRETAMYSRETNLKQTTVATRAEIVRKLDAGHTVKSLAQEYGVSTRSILRYKKNAIKITAHADNWRNENRKRQRTSPYEDIEVRLYHWFIQSRLVKDTITDRLIQEKAKEIYKEIGGPSTFNANRGWLCRFKQKYEIRLMKLREAIQDVNGAAAIGFISEFSQLISDEKIKEQNVYCMDETSLFWRSLPRKLLKEEEERVTKTKEKEDRVTIGFCANASGTHKLPLLFVNKYENPRALKHCKNNLPVTYMSHPHAWVYKSVFRSWYLHYFKQEVKRHQQETLNEGKVILLVDNFNGHKLFSNEIDDGHFKIVFIPPNTSSLILPLDQGIILKCKKSFRHKLLRRVQQYDEGIMQFYADYDVKDCIDMISDAWNNITIDSAYNSWSKVLNRSVLKEEIKEDPDSEIPRTDIPVEVTTWISECAENEVIEEEAITDEEIDTDAMYPPCPIENEEIDHILYNLEKICLNDLKIHVHAHALLDYFKK